MAAFSAVLLAALPATAASLEQVDVVGRRLPGAGNSAQPGFSTVIVPDDLVAPARDLAEVLVTQPGVSYNGQGGLFQTISIRGLSRARIGSFYLDIPLLTERRAGTAASFIDPAMLSSVELVRGVASTHYGLGNVGGLVALRPAQATTHGFSAGWGSRDDENHQSMALAGERSVLMLSHRGADDADSAAGAPLHTGYDQYNLMFDTGGELGGSLWTFNTLLSYGDDIGKSNNLYPDQRITDYPRERHWLAQLGLERPEAWQGSVYFHYQELDTSVERLQSRRNETRGESLDVGGRWLADVTRFGPALRVGADWLGRLNVEVREQETRFADDLVTHRSNLDAGQQELALFAESRLEYAQGELTAGLRGTAIWQHTHDWDNQDELFLSAYGAGRWFVSQRLALEAELSTGERSPGLSERFFSGTTGRSQVLGNPDLDRERVSSLDLGLSWAGDALRLDIHSYFQTVDDFVERVQIAEDLLGFRNVSNGDIYGVDGSLDWQLSPQWQLNASGQWIDSRDDDGEPLQDVPGAQVGLELSYLQARWSARLGYHYRFSDDDIAATELPVDSAQRLLASLDFRFNESLSVRVWGRNLLDDEYVVSSDDLATQAAQRAFGLELHWRAVK
jgi:outer membrane receptor protein involved in Fe transport